jgi:transcriptional regulator with XRE-family HTH domain
MLTCLVQGRPDAREFARASIAPGIGKPTVRARPKMPNSPQSPTLRAVADMPYPGPVAQGTWWQYVATVTGNAAQKDIAAATGIDQSSISRWQRGTNTPRAEAVVTLARTYGRSPVEALVAAGYLSSSDIGVVELTTLTGDLTTVSIDSLLTELRRRVLIADPEHAQSWPAGWSAHDPGMSPPQNGEQSGDLGG